MVSFETKNPNLDNILRVLQWKMLVYFVAIWSIFPAIWQILFGHLVYFPRFGTFYPFWYVVPRQVWQPCSWVVLEHTMDGKSPPADLGQL
jgi:hypothetical protein